MGIDWYCCDFCGHVFPETFSHTFRFLLKGEGDVKLGEECCGGIDFMEKQLTFLLEESKKTSASDIKDDVNWKEKIYDTEMLVFAPKGELLKKMLELKEKQLKELQAIVETDKNVTGNKRPRIEDSDITTKPITNNNINDMKSTQQ